MRSDTIALERKRTWLQAWCRGNVSWLLGGRAVRSFAQAVLVVAVPLYVAAAGYSAQELGYLLTVASFGAIAYVAGVGFLADRYGRRTVMIGVAALSAAGAALYAATTNFWGLALASALATIGRGGERGRLGCLLPGGATAGGGELPPGGPERGLRAMSFVTVLASAAGSAVSALGEVAHRSLRLPWLAAYRLLFLLAALASLVLLLLCLPLRENRAPAPRVRLSRASLELIGKLWVTNSLTGLAWGLLGPFMTYWLHRRFGVGPAALGSLYTLINLVTAPFFLGAAPVARRLGAVRAVVVTRLISVAFLLALAVAPTFRLAALFYCLRTIFNSMGMPVRQSFVMGVAEEGNRSMVAALSNLPSQATAAVSPTLGAYLMVDVAMASPLFLAAAVLLLNAAGYYWAFRDTRPPEEARPSG